MSIFRRSILFTGVITVVCVFILGCQSGRVPELEGIKGPDSVEENSQVEYSMVANKGPNASYFWTCDPPELGEFDPSTSQETTFHAANVYSVTPVTIRALVEANQLDPVLSEKRVVIQDVGNDGWVRVWRGTGTWIAIDYSNGWDVAVDSTEDVYVAGDFVALDGPADFDPGPMVDEHTSNGMNDAYLSKFDEDGNFIWARTWGGSSQDKAYGVAVDSTGNVYVTGYFQSTVDLDPGPAVMEITSLWGRDIFLCKFSPGGDLIWVRTWEGQSSETVVGVVIDGADNAYIAGEFYDSLDLDPGPGTDIRTPLNYTSIYLVKLDSQGNFQWANNWGDMTYRCFGIAANDTGHICVTGRGDNGAFVTKYDSNGYHDWIRFWGGETVVYGNAVSVDNLGYVYVSGRFDHYVDLDPGENEYLLVAESNQDSYLSKFDPYGNFLWGHGWNINTDIDSRNLIATDHSGNVFLTGFCYASTDDLDPGPGVDNKPGYGFKDVFLVSLRADGNYNWGRKWGTDGDELGRSVTVDEEGNIYVTGRSGEDIFLMKLGPDGNW